MPSSGLGWQPSRFLTDRGQAEHAFALAERLGSVNAAATELGTTWPSLRKALTRHGLGIPARNPEAVRQRAIAAACQRSGQPATPTPRPGVRTDLTNPRSGDGCRCPLTPYRPDQPDSETRFAPVVDSDVPGLWPKAPLGYQ
jgi:hypothetical protein